MKNYRGTLLGSVLAGLFVTLAHASPPTVNPEQVDMDISTTTTIMKEKSKRSTQGQAAAGEPGAAKDSGCGQVNIANNDKKSNSGIGSMMAKPQTVIITGPVVNMANCK
jgi:hypothetical protein